MTGSARGLESGRTLATALLAAPDVPAEAVARIAAAEPLGQLRRRWAKALEKSRQADRTAGTRGDTDFYRFYPIALLCMMTYGLMGFMIFVLPRFREIFADFKMDLPLLTRNLVAVGILSPTARCCCFSRRWCWWGRCCRSWRTA